MEREDIILAPEFAVTFAGNTFVGVPVILMVDEEPLVAVTNSVTSTPELGFDVFSADGIKLAVAKKSQLHLTKEGEKANLKRRNEVNLSVIELDGKPILESRRNGPTAVTAVAEIYTPTGFMFRCRASAHELPGVVLSPQGVQSGSVNFSGNVLVGAPVGLRIGSDGSLRIG